ncbi:hypothetical protein EON64_14590 [archaeon]|nr:MAG: hypothetical protein EON64_14590 [archaeon]
MEITAIPPLPDQMFLCLQIPQQAETAQLLAECIEDDANPDSQISRSTQQASRDEIWTKSYSVSWPICLFKYHFSFFVSISASMDDFAVSVGEPTKHIDKYQQQFMRQDP